MKEKSEIAMHFTGDLNAKVEGETRFNRKKR